MKTISRYVLTEFLKTLFMSCVALLTLFLVIDMVENAGELLERGLSVGECARYFAFKAPVYAVQVLPVAVLLSSFITMALLNRNNEITAMKAGGIGVAKIASPVLFAGLFISLAVIALNENIVPAAQKEINAVKSKIKIEKSLYFGSQGFWIRGSDVIYNIKKMDMNKNSMEGVTVYAVSSPFKITDEIKIGKASWDGVQWVPSPSGKGGKVSAAFVEKGITALRELKRPEELTFSGKNYEYMNYAALRRYIRTLDRGGYDTSKYSVELYSKISFPFVNLVMAFIGIPFALRSGRNVAVAAGVALSIGIGFSFWIVFGLCRTLGAEGVVPPLVAAWFPVALFLAIGAYLFEYVRQ